MRHLIVPVVLAVAALAFGPAAGAQDAGRGELSAAAYRPMPNDRQMTVRALDNAEQDMALVETMRRALRQRGYSVADDADLIFTIETEELVGAYSTTDRRTVLELRGEGGDFGGEDAEARLNLFDSQTGGIMNKGSSGTTIVTPSQYRVEITLDDRSSGKRVWQGWAVAPKQPGGGDEAVLTRMVVALADNLGQTVRREAFSIR